MRQRRENAILPLNLGWNGISGEYDKLIFFSCCTQKTHFCITFLIKKRERMRRPSNLKGYSKQSTCHPSLGGVKKTWKGADRWVLLLVPKSYSARKGKRREREEGGGGLRASVVGHRAAVASCNFAFLFLSLCFSFLVIRRRRHSRGTGPGRLPHPPAAAPAPAR